MAGVLKYTVIVRNPDTLIAVPLLAGKPVPKWAKDLVSPDDLVDQSAAGAEDDQEPGGEGSGGEAFDPAANGVDDVNNHLAESGADEVKQVLAAEAAGKNRKGIVEGPYAEVD